MNKRKYKPEDYAYAIGRVRFREGLLLRREHYERFLRSKDFNQFFATLKDSPYSDFCQQNPEQALDSAWLENLQFFQEYTLDSWVLKLFLNRFDLHNIKLTIKAKLLKEKPAPLIPYGTIPIQLIEQLPDRIFIPDFFKSAVEIALKEFYLAQDPALLSIILESQFLFYQLKAAQMNNFLFNYFQSLIDLTNLSAFFRLRTFGESEKFFIKSFTQGGKLSLKTFLNLFSEPVPLIIARFQSSPYRLVVEEGLDYLETQKSFIRFERLKKEYLLNILLSTRYLTFGYEPLVAYFLFKEEEIQNLRIILQGIRYQIPTGMIKESLATL